MDTSLSSVEKLDGTNYMTWSFKMKMFMKSKEWLKVLMENPPAEESALENWNKMDADVMNMMVQTMMAKETIYMLNENTAKAAWNKLTESYQMHLLLSLLGNTGPMLNYMMINLLIITQLLLLTLEFAVSIIQTYVFAILSTLYSSKVI